MPVKHGAREGDAADVILEAAQTFRKFALKGEITTGELAATLAIFKAGRAIFDQGVMQIEAIIKKNNLNIRAEAYKVGDH